MQRHEKKKILNEDRWVPIVANVTFGIGAFLLTSEKTAVSRTFILRTLTLCLI